MKSSYFSSQDSRSGYCKRGLLFCFLLLLISMTGCGKKELPLPPPEEIPPGVVDLSGNLDGDTLTFSWSIPEGKNADLLVGYQVYRSASPIQDTDCPDCPVNFWLLGDMKISEFNTSDTESRKLVFTHILEPEDKDTMIAEDSGPVVQPGSDQKKRPDTRIYQYKVVGYTDYNVKSPDSNVISIHHPVKTGEAQNKGSHEK
ncbi:MAG: hypothetical protein EHJ94_02315 [Deltaproteobacteria bacterium]|nr:MAG: hypothetical protein EHJ94_02315 [Deltaproteobacteria bacterium]